MNYKRIFPLFIGLFSVFVSAQTVIPKMNITRETNANPMVLQELDIDIYVVGQTAVTTMEMVFYNPNDRVMEGEFEFPLGDGQQVSRFALDINGKLREGVVVDKKQGRVAFESIVRRGIDPGLLEKTEGNNFKARVYPMPAKGTRRVLIAFEQELSEKNGQDFYFLPIKNNLKLKKFNLKAEVVSRFVKAETQNSLALDFKNWRNSYISEISKTDYQLSENVALVLPKVEKPQIMVASDKEKTYFYGNVPVQKSVTKQKELPKKIGLLWDASSSGKKRNLKAEYDLLDMYFKTLKNVEVQVNTFNINTSKITHFSVKNGNWSALKSFLENVIYDGATDVNALVFNQKNDEFLLFSDGIFNFGQEQNIASITKNIKRPVYVINSNIVANTHKIKVLASVTGGNFIDLTKNSAEKSLAQLLENPYRLLDIKVKSGKVSDLYPAIQSVVSEANFTFSGELLSQNAELVFSFGYGNKITEEKQVILDKNTSSTEKEFSLLRRIWAQKKIAQMRLEGSDKSEIDAVGKEFGIVTEGTSLIVLEEISDYVRYKIVPPSELQTEYFRLIEQEKRAKKQEEANKKEKENRNIEQVIELSEEQTKWWKTNYPISEKRKSQPIEEVVEATAEEIAESSNATSEVAFSDRISQEVVADEIQKDVEGVVVTGNAPRMRRSMVSSSVTIVTTKEVVYNQQDSKNINIQLNAWNPDTPYAKVLQYADDVKAYETYLKLKEEYGETPAFYVDAADYFFKKGKCETAVLILSNLAELNLEDVQLLRILGYKLTEYDSPKQAISVFRKVLKLKEEEPQSYRDLGLALAQNKEYNEAVKMLYKVVTDDWDGRFEGIQLIAMNEINNIVNTQKNIDISFIDRKLLKKEPVDIRVVLTWDTDNSDMDLWVTDPKAEKCSYQNKLTYLGGKISNDITQGYGPEEFMIKKAVKGDYKIEVDYYGNDSQKQLFPVSLRIEFFTHYGTSQQKKQEVVVRVSEEESVIDVGKFLYN